MSPVAVFGRISRIERHKALVLRQVFSRHGMDSGEYDVLAALRRSGEPYRLTPTELYRSMIVTSATMTERVDRLERRRLIRRRNAPNDRRSILVELTPKGAASFESVHLDLLETEDQLLEGLNSKERSALAELLCKLATSLEENSRTATKPDSPTRRTMTEKGEGMKTSEQSSAVITGGNKGLGFETARRLGQLGWTVFLGSRDQARGQTAADKLIDGGAKVVLVPLDVTSDESVSEALRLVSEHTHGLDVLINNAGVPGEGIRPADATVEDVHSVYDTNVYGPIRVTHAFLPLLKAADHPRVVMVSSAGGSFTAVTDPEQPFSRIHELAYSSSKTALNMVTLRYAQALPHIKFNVATPGEVRNRKFAATDMNHHTGELTVTEGTDSIVRLATIGADGPTGTFMDRLGPVAW